MGKEVSMKEVKVLTFGCSFRIIRRERLDLILNIPQAILNSQLLLKKRLVLCLMQVWMREI